MPPRREWGIPANGRQSPSPAGGSAKGHCLCASVARCPPSRRKGFQPIDVECLLRGSKQDPSQGRSFVSPRSHPCVQAKPPVHGGFASFGPFLLQFIVSQTKPEYALIMQPSLLALRASIEHRQHPNIDICWNPWRARTAAGSLSRRAQSRRALALRGHWAGSARRRSQP